MGKSLHPIRNWSEYNRGLVERGSFTVWMDASAIASWHNVEHHGGRGRIALLLTPVKNGGITE